MTRPAIAQSVSPYRQLLVGFSGGLDSTVLLHRLMLWREKEPDVQIRAIHIHHGLSPFADEWVAHCASLCLAWNIPLLIERVTLLDEGLGTEAQARKARYAAFEKSLLPGEAIVTAQHLDDQCETFLLALKRGSGPAGLSAMAERSEFVGTHLLRPLLGETRASLECWAQEHHLRWIEDESNQDDAYDRNFLRLRILPELSQRWPHFAESTARSAKLCAEQESLLDELLSEELESLMSQERALRIAPLQAMSAVRRGALLRRWLAGHNAQMPSRDMLNRIWELCRYSIKARGVLTGTISPSGTRIFFTTPETVDSTSIVALSVSTSMRFSPRSTRSPSFLCQATMRPSSITSPNMGILNSVAIVLCVFGLDWVSVRLRPADQVPRRLDD